MKIRYMALIATAAVGLSSHAMAQAFGYTTVSETASGGYVGAIPTSSPALMVASDGEASFDPFGAGYDTSDGIQLNSNWAPDPAYAAAFKVWTQLPGTFTWVLPSCVNGVCENGNVYEPVAKWDYTPGAGWNAGTTGLQILEADGTLSDLVTIANDGVNGVGATITFNSNAVPEPATWAVMLTGFFGIGMAMRSRRKLATAVA